MGALDKKQKVYFSDPKRFADAWNGILFGGLEVIRWQELSECDSVITNGEGKGEERIADAIMKKTSNGTFLAMLILENQRGKDYSLPVRLFHEEALAYKRQANVIERRNEKLWKDLEQYGDLGKVFYYFRRTDRLRPVVMIVLYWNEEPWDGANSLDEMIDFRGAEELRPLVPKHPVQIVDMSRFEDKECFHTDLRSVVEYFQRRNDKEAFREYYNQCEPEYELDTEGREVVSELVNSAELKKLIKKRKGKGESESMCKAITELIEEGREEGRKEGREEAQARIEAAEAKASAAEEENEKLRAEVERLKKRLERGGENKDLDGKRTDLGKRGGKQGRNECKERGQGAVSVQSGGKGLF